MKKKDIMELIFFVIPALISITAVVLGLLIILGTIYNFINRL